MQRRFCHLIDFDKCLIYASFIVKYILQCVLEKSRLSGWQYHKSHLVPLCFSSVIFSSKSQCTVLVQCMAWYLTSLNMFILALPYSIMYMNTWKCMLMQTAAGCMFLKWAKAIPPIQSPSRPDFTRNPIFTKTCSSVIKHVRRHKGLQIPQLCEEQAVNRAPILFNSPIIWTMLLLIIVYGTVGLTIITAFFDNWKYHCSVSR